MSKNSKDGGVWKFYSLDGNCNDPIWYHVIYWAEEELEVGKLSAHEDEEEMRFDNHPTNEQNGDVKYA